MVLILGESVSNNLLICKACVITGFTLYTNKMEEQQQEFNNMERCANMIHLVSSLLRQEGYTKDSEVLVALYKVIEYRNSQEGQYQDQVENWNKKTSNNYDRYTDIVLDYINDKNRDAERMGLPIIPNDERIANELRRSISRPGTN